MIRSITLDFPAKIGIGGRRVRDRRTACRARKFRVIYGNKDEEDLVLDNSAMAVVDRSLHFAQQASNTVKDGWVARVLRDVSALVVSKKVVEAEFAVDMVAI